MYLGQSRREDGAGGSLTADANTQLGLHPCTPAYGADGLVLVSIGRAPARPQQQGCDEEKTLPKKVPSIPKWHQHCMW